MSRRAIFFLVAVIAAVAAVWRSQLQHVSDPRSGAHAIMLTPASERERVHLDVILPVVPVGLHHLRADGGALIVQYWAPWIGGSLDQAMQLDSLRRDPAFQDLGIVMVTADPFPSVARYVGRHRLQTPVLLDGQHQLRDVLPCPSLPYAYVLDPSGRVAVAQEGLVAWVSDSTRHALTSLLH